MTLLSQGFTRALHETLSNSASIVDFSSPTGFEQCWDQVASDAQLPEAWQDNGRLRPVVLVWDGWVDVPNPHPAPVDHHTTPLDWALAFSRKYAQRPAEIHVVLLGRQGCEQWWAIKNRQLLLRAMPGLRIWAPLPRAGEGALLDLALLGARDPSPSDADLLESVEHLWRSSIRATGDHHDVNNALGPLMFGVESENLHVRALSNRLGPRGKRSVKLGQSRMASRVVLVDDMIEHGWGRVIRGLVDANVFALSNADTIIESLKGAPFRERDYTFEFLPQDGHPSPEVLLLDLNLAHGSPKQEEEVVRTLSGLVAEKELRGGSNLAWPPIDLHTGTEAKTLLPRLCALASPSTPIIVLSAVRDARVSDTLRPYGNIVWLLRKPDVLSDLGSPGSFESDLRFALEAAQALLDTRAHLAKVQKCADELGPKRNRPYIEIYLDESGEHDALTVGGVVGVFSDPEAAAAFDRRAYEKGVRYFDDLQGIGGRPINAKGTPCDGALGDALAGEDVTLFKVSVSASDVLTFRVGDWNYLASAGVLLELLLCEVLPALYPGYECGIYLGTRKLEITQDLARVAFNFGYEWQEQESVTGRTFSLAKSITGSSALVLLARIIRDRAAAIHDCRITKAVARLIPYEDDGWGRPPMVPTVFRSMRLTGGWRPSGRVSATRRQSDIPRHLRQSSQPDHPVLLNVADEVIGHNSATYASLVPEDSLPGFAKVEAGRMEKLLAARRLADRCQPDKDGGGAIALGLRAYKGVSESPLSDLLLGRLWPVASRLSGFGVLEVCAALMPGPWLAKAPAPTLENACLRQGQTYDAELKGREGSTWSILVAGGLALIGEHHEGWRRGTRFKVRADRCSVAGLWSCTPAP